MNYILQNRDMPNVTFIIPIYNCERYLVQCLDSILHQSIDDFEVILVNDGSTDKSGEICEIYANRDERFRVIHKSNEGVSKARNWGIELSKGEWITFVDADDWVDSDFLELLKETQQVDYIVSSITGHNNDDEYYMELFEAQTFSFIDQSVFDPHNLQIAFFTPWCKFFKARIIKDNNIRFDPEIHSGEDTIFVFQYLRYIRSIYLSRLPLYHWRVANGLTNKKYSFRRINYTIDQTMAAFCEVEQMHKVDLSIIKFNSLNYLTNKIDVRLYSLYQLYFEILKVSRKKWMRDMIIDSTYLIKGKRRRLLDMLMCRKAFITSAVLCKICNKFY